MFNASSAKASKSKVFSCSFVIKSMFTLRCSVDYKWKLLTIRITIVRNIKWDKVFKNGRSKICGRQPLKNLK